MHRVLILGGGFGGIAAAVALRARLDLADEVVLVERRPAFVMGLRKNWGLVGSAAMAEGTRSLDELAARGIRVVAGTISAIRPSERAADVDGQRLDGDALVVALGAEGDPDRIPGFGVHAIDVYDPDGNARGAAAIAAFRGGRVVIGIFGTPYPCPPAPYELAILLAERFEAQGVSAGLLVFSPQPRSLPILGGAGCATFEGRLALAGVSFRPNTQATAVEADGVVTPDLAIPYDLLLGVPPHRVPRVVTAAGLTDGRPWVAVNRQTLETRFADVYAIGDVTEIPLANGMPLPKAGVFAGAQAEVVVARIADRLRGREPTASFNGDGMCYLETGHGVAAVVRGGFFGDPPDVVLTDSSPDHLAAKRNFETERLAAWFGR